MAESGKWSIIVHGGVKTIRPGEEEPHREEALSAVNKGASVLQGGGTAIDAVEQAVRAMERGGLFNAGCGSAMRADGSVQMDASIMDGWSLDIGAVTCIENVEHPISVARALLDEPQILLIGEHATKFARMKGFPACATTDATSAQDAAHDTVGCVARDAAGNIAVALSTGGISGAMPGRVGDTVLPGCGFYADNTRGGLCFSGEGEKIARSMLAAEVLRGLETMPPLQAIEAAFPRIEKIGGEAGCILIDREGNVAWSHNSPHFAVAYQTSDGPTPAVFIRK